MLTIVVTFAMNACGEKGSYETESHQSGKPINFSNGDSFEISESGCIGCRAYSMRLDGNGVFQFQERSPKKWQVEHARLSTEQLQAFLRIIGASNFELFSKLKMNCKQAGSEQSIVTMTLTISGKPAKVIHDTGCTGFDGEDSLLAFERNLMGALDIDHLTSDDKTIEALRDK